MKARLLILSLLIGMLVAGSAWARPDPQDPFGLMDTVILVPQGDPASGHFQVELWVYSDEGLSGVTIGFVWNNPKVQMDSAKASALTSGAFTLGTFFYEQANITLTNTNLRFLFGGLAFTSPLAGDGSGRRLWATYYFNTTGWTDVDAVTFDETAWGLGTDYSFVEFDLNTEFYPAFLGALTDVTGTVQENLPVSFALKQNYPNPFNPATTISFDLPSKSNVRLTVYNVLGQEVITLIDREMDADQHSVSWDASKQASGVYFYRLEAGSFTETRKMLLLK